VLAAGATALAAGITAKRRTAGTRAASAVATRAPKTLDAAGIFEDLFQRSNLAGRVLANLPSAVPMPILSVYTALPLLAALAAAVCPRHTRLAQGLASALGCLLGTLVGAFLKQGKKDAASCAIARLLSTHIQEDMPTEELRSLIHRQRRRFGVPANDRSSESWEDSSLQKIYEELLVSLLDGPEHDPYDLPTLQRLKAVLDLDGIVVGNAHRHAAQLLVSKGYSGLEGEPMRIAMDKLLFLSQRAFADEEPEEASRYEMGRLCQVLKVSDKDATKRVQAVSRALYQQNLSAVVDKVDAHTGEALAGAQMAFGLAGEEAERMNLDTYKEIAKAQLADGVLTSDGKATLEQARGVLQLRDKAASAAFAAVSGPILHKELDTLLPSLKDSAVAAEKLKEFATKLASRGEEIGLSSVSTFTCVRQALQEILRSMYNVACKEARTSAAKALGTMDEMMALTKASDTLLKQMLAGLKETEEEVEDGRLTLTADPLPGRRLYGLYLERSLKGKAPASDPDQFASILELSEEDAEAARVETCQPRLREMYLSCIKKAQDEKSKLAEMKPDLSDEMAKFRLPLSAVEETAMEVYKSCLEKVSGRVLKSVQKEELDAVRDFMELEMSSVRRLHLKAFASTYEESVREALGRSGVMSEEAQEALSQLGDRLGLETSDTEKIFHGVVEERLREMMIPVRDAWEEATYTKEALLQLNKERGKDLGDDPTADGTGAELGIKDSPPLEGVRGFKLMEELTKVADFYTNNKVLKDDAVDSSSDDEDAWAAAYPVQVGKWIEDKNKEEMYGIFVWNAITCQDTAARDKWTAAKTVIGGILGLSPKVQQKVLVRMVSRWCNMFIKSKVQEQGELKKDDVSMLTDWAPMFFGIEKDVTMDMVQAANKSLLQNKVLKILNKPSVTPEDLSKLRAEVDEWDLEVAKDLELSRPQLRSLFRVEVASVVEDPDLSDEQKVDGIEASREAFGLAEKEAMSEMQDLIKSRCRSCLVNASGDLLQENEAAAVDQMQRLELLAAFGLSTGVEFQDDWEVAPAMRQKLVKTYAAGSKGRAPDTRMLERVLSLVHA